MAERTSNVSDCGLRDPRVRAVLDRLHREAGRQTLAVARLAPSFLAEMLARRQPSLSEEVSRLKNLYVPVSPKQGQFIYSVARSIRAQRIVEFGTSFGVSTTYLAAVVNWHYYPADPQSNDRAPATPPR